MTKIRLLAGRRNRLRSVDERPKVDGRRDNLAPLVGARYLVIQALLYQIDFRNRILGRYGVSELDCCHEPYAVITKGYRAADAHARRSGGHEPNHQCAVSNPFAVSALPHIFGIDMVW